MRTFLLLLLALGACAAPQRQMYSPSRASATLAQFSDSAPHAWSDTRPRSYPVHGIDVSRWQGEIDWPRVRASGIAFAFVKATEGGDVRDPMFAANWQRAGAAGVPRGAYHLYYFCRTAAEQAAWFALNVPRDIRALPPVLDMEWNAHPRSCPYRPAPERVRAEMRVMLAAMEQHTGKRPLVYTTLDFYRDNALGEMRDVAFWLRSTAAHPSASYPGQPWMFWQHTGTGVIDGIVGPTDINAYAGSQSEWRRWLASNTQ